MQNHTAYTVEFGLQEFRISEASNSFTLPVITTARGSPSRNAIVSFTRNDTVNGPPIDDLIVNNNMTGRLEVEVQIPNDVVRTGDRVFNVTLMTTDTLVVIGEHSTVTVHVTEDDCKFSLLFGGGGGEYAGAKLNSHQLTSFPPNQGNII